MSLQARIGGDRLVFALGKLGKFRSAVQFGAKLMV
jgi:hypothetical protein